MNSIPAKISHIEVFDGLSMITVDADGQQIRAIVIDTPDSAPYIHIGNEVYALIKETEILISCDDDPHISVRNRIPCSISSIDNGKLLSRVRLVSGNIELNAVIPSDAISELNLSTGKNVLAMVKINEVMLSHD